jgi:hypothetical protein
MKTQDPPTRAAFVTALSGAYLVPRDDGYAVFWRSSGHDLCAVDPAVADQALHNPGEAVRLGSWSGAIRGRDDEWTLWWARGLLWASTSDVTDGDQTLQLIEHWRAAVARAEACGERWDPPVPASSSPPAPSRPRVARARLGVRDGVRALLGGR